MAGRWRLGVLCLLLLACLATCARKPAPAPTPPLRVGWFLWTGWYPMVLARELGLFAKHGVAVDPILYTSYNEILPDLAAGKLDGGLSGLYETLKADIPGLRVVLVTDHSVGGEGVVVVPAIQSAADLRGKRIGYQGALSGSEFVITTYLRKQGLSPRDLVLVSVSPEQVLAQMPSQIDGGYTWDPFLGQAQRQGHRVLFSTADMPGLIVDVVAIHGAVIERRRADVQRFVDAWLEAVDYWRAHPAEAAAIIARATGQRPEDISLAGCRLFGREENRATFRPGEDFGSVRHTARKQVEFFVGVGDASTAPDPARTLDDSFVR